MIFAASILAGKKVKVPTFVVPGSTEVHADMLKLNVGGEPKADGEKSIMDVLADAGCTIGPSGCAACLGGPADTFGRLNEPLVCVSTTNRNFPGRMGHKEAGVYLASPLTAAASAITGRITDPREFITGPIPTGSAGVV
jgi:3-isopropylmalate/(R)-2-methylmalate dehydratase large subunit